MPFTVNKLSKLTTQSFYSDMCKETNYSLSYYNPSAPLCRILLFVHMLSNCVCEHSPDRHDTEQKFQKAECKQISRISQRQYINTWIIDKDMKRAWENWECTQSNISYVIKLWNMVRLAVLLTNKYGIESIHFRIDTEFRCGGIQLEKTARTACINYRK